MKDSARDDRAVRLGVGLDALGLFLYAGVPAVLGIACRGMFPALAVTAASIVLLLTIFYTLLTVSLFVPIVAGLLVPRTTVRDALASIVAGVAGMPIIQFATDGRGWGLATPAFGELAAAVTACAIPQSTGGAHPVVVPLARRDHP